MCKMLLEYEELEENHGGGENREEWCYQLAEGAAQQVALSQVVAAVDG